MLRYALKAVTLCCALLGCGGVSAAMAGTWETTYLPYVRPAPAHARSYYIEFRGRSEIAGFGHAFITLGDIDAAGRSQQTAVFGFVPQGDFDQFLSPTALPVQGSISVSLSDFTPHPDVRFRVPISRAQYDRIVGMIGEYRATWTVYELLLHNCNNFVAEVAGSLGLKLPPTTIELPVDYVADLKSANAAH